MVKMFGSITDLSHVLVAKEGNVSKIEFMRSGKWDHPVYGKIEITKSRLEKFKENFDNGVRSKVPIDREHKTDEGAYGWVLSFSVEEGLNDKGEAIDKLMGSVEWTDEGVASVKSKKYRFFSPEFTDIYKDAKSGGTFNDVILGGAITNRPFFQELDEVIVLSEDNTSVKNSKKKKESIMTKEEMKKKIKENAKFSLPEDASDEDKSTMKDAKAEMCSEFAADAETATAAKVAAETQLAEATKKLSEAEANAGKAFTEQNAEAAQIFSELGVKTLEDAKALSASLKASEEAGVKAEIEKIVLPKTVDATLKFAMTLEKENRKVFMETLKAQNVAQMFAEVGGETTHEDGGPVKAPEGVDPESFKLDQAARKLMSEKPAEFKELSEDAAYNKAVHMAYKASEKKSEE